MVFERIEKLKQQYTDKYVTVDESRPELKRFGGMTGTVRTVNMSGRALVEFDANSNIGWYDIDLDFLKVIDAPLPKVEANKSEAKASPKASSPAPKAAPAAKPASGGGMSVADMLAAARGKGGGNAPAAKPSSAADIMAAARSQKGGAAPAKVDPKSMSVADMLAAARGGKSGSPAVAAKPAAAPKKDPKSMSVAEMLAAARGEASGAAPTAAPVAADPKAGVRDLLESARKTKPGAVAEAPEPAEEAPASEPSPTATGGRRNDITSVADQLAYCRKTDAR
ncbi:MAG: hypothetical protein H6822_13635 [Planctomycetaceae bacterium]|nr:hypothetical protein [Planctomycetales bacterium]MCB9923218.1 hypothetical protein [Planctomycetaceae bacterium]